jgi:F0F1-type ATP synthase membrane subunit b/b'
VIPVPLWAWALLGVFLWGAYGHWQYDRLERQRVEANAETVRLVAKAQNRAQDEARKVQDEYAEKLRRASSATRTLRADNARLQQKLAGSAGVPRDAETVCGVDGERGRALEELLAGGSDLAARGAEEVVRLSAKISGLQSYIQRVCIGEQSALH